jgi:hypothetical protein
MNHNGVYRERLFCHGSGTVYNARKEAFDYAKWQENLCEGMTIEAIYAKAARETTFRANLFENMRRRAELRANAKRTPPAPRRLPVPA